MHVAAILAVPSLTPATAASGLSFGLTPKTTASAAPLTGFSFGIPPKTSAPGGGAFGLGAGICFVPVIVKFVVMLQIGLMWI